MGKEYKKGDRVFIQYKGSVCKYGIATIKRVTKTLLIVENMRFKRINVHYTSAIAEEGRWYLYDIGDKDIIEQHINQCLRATKREAIEHLDDIITELNYYQLATLKRLAKQLKDETK